MEITEVLRNTLAASQLIPAGFRVRILRVLGISLGKGSSVASGVTIKGNAVTIGEGCFINQGVYIDRGELVMGDGVFVGPRVMFATRNHEVGQPDKRAGKTVNQPIMVGSGSWIGANVTILGGVTIGPGCVIAAGAVVTRDTERDSVYAGVPATRVKDLTLSIKDHRA